MLHLFSLKRWETYCLLAMASVSWLIVVSLHTHQKLHRAAHPETTRDTLVPVSAFSRMNDPHWRARHLDIVRKANAQSYDILLLGDSITQGWEYQPDAWQESFPGLSTLNAGISSDRVEHMLWRVRHGLLDQGKPSTVVLMGGINNLAVSSPQQIAGGISQIIAEIHHRSPTSQILLLGLLPSGASASHPRRVKIERVNALLHELADGYHVHYLDVGPRFLDVGGKLAPGVSFDGVHLTHHGYEIWGKALKPTLSSLLGLMSH